MTDMGMYTALHLAVALKRDTPNEVIAILRYMLDETDHMTEPMALPDHDLFHHTIRWRNMLLCDSYYFEFDTHSVLRTYPASAGWSLSITCNFKNYASELELFLDWIMPYVDGSYRKWLGYWMYEEDDEPTPIFYPDEWATEAAGWVLKNGREQTSDRKPSRATRPGICPDDLHPVPAADNDTTAQISAPPNQAVDDD